jgi:hypothetical protein
MDKKLLEALALELKKHPENGNITLRELVEGVVKNTEGKVDEVLDKVETSEIPEYYFFKS